MSVCQLRKACIIAASISSTNHLTYLLGKQNQVGQKYRNNQFWKNDSECREFHGSNDFYLPYKWRRINIQPVN